MKLYKITNKKGAMFDLFRALRKQSGGLFLAKRQSADSHETHGSLKTNRGAMFGLDARIALAIFGALSVISGAALYSAIKEAKLTATIVEFNEIAKAIISYQIDTGHYLPEDGNLLKAGELIQSSERGWKGPYLTYGWIDEISVKSEKYGSIMVRFEKDDWTACANIDDPDCFVWLMVRKSTTEPYMQNLMDHIDEKVDGVSDLNNGDVKKSGPFYHYKIHVK